METARVTIHEETYSDGGVGVYIERTDRKPLLSLGWTASNVENLLAWFLRNHTPKSAEDFLAQFDEVEL